MMVSSASETCGAANASAHSTAERFRVKAIVIVVFSGCHLLPA
ncbi:hypothetical protein BN128_1254 [Cronobacter sakazakii 696]|nr:hypothetical protein BN128_1254 [Cronobacter sakazakii 696]